MRQLSKLFGLLLAVALFYGCGGSDSTSTDLPNIDELGAIDLRFNADGTQPRFSDATNYRVFIFIPGTTTQLASTVFFSRDFNQNVQSVFLNAIPAGTVDLVIEALNAEGRLVGQAIAEDVVVVTGQATLVDSDDLVGIGISEGVDFDGTGTSNANEVITVQVSSGTTPTYSWDGANARDVSVVRENDPNDPSDVTPVWVVTTIDADNLASPVTQGQVPTGATLAVNEESVLTAGQAYRVSVTRVNGEFGVVRFIP